MAAKASAQSIPIVLIPGVNCSARLFTMQIPSLWRSGPVTVADHTREDDIGLIARRILDHAPQYFALAGFSLGGFIAFEMIRQAPHRILRLALMHTSAHPETAEQDGQRRSRVERVKAGYFSEIVDAQYPKLVHASRHDEPELLELYRSMAADSGPDAFVRQQIAVMGLIDSRPTLGLVRCPTLVVTGDSDTLTSPDHAREMAVGIAGARLVIIPSCAHLSPIERPSAVTAAMVEWLAG
jgi:pimeloyl-ACP methyl ester carboxylesterase